MIRLMTTAAAASLLAIPPAAFAATIEIESEGPVVELSIYESVTAEPDLATIGAGVTSEAPTAVEAMRQNAAEMRKVIDQIKALGVAEEDIQTTGISLNARYDYNRQTRRNVFRGYAVSNRVSVKLREIDEVGRVLDALVTAGATDLNGPTFSIENDEAAKEQARERAIKTGMERAKAYARMVGYQDVRILEISETIKHLFTYGNDYAAMEVAEEAAESVPVEPGRVSAGVNIIIKYEMLSDGDEVAE